MNKDLGFGVARPGAELERSPSEEEKAGPRPGETLMWAQTVLTHVVRQIPRLGASPEPPQAAAAGAVENGEAGSITDSRAGETLTEGRAGESRAAESRAASGPALPARLVTELSDEHLGQLSLTVTRSAQGLDIVIGVADSRVKALIMADQDQLAKSLQGCGLRVASVQVGDAVELGTALAQQGVGAPAARSAALERSKGASAARPPTGRWQGTYPTSQDEDGDTTERIDLTA